MIDTNRRYTEQEIAVLGEQGYEFVGVTQLHDSEPFYMVASWSSPAAGEGVELDIDGLPISV